MCIELSPKESFILSYIIAIRVAYSGYIILNDCDSMHYGADPLPEVTGTHATRNISIVQEVK